MLEKAGSMSHSVSSWSIPIVIVPTKAHLEEQPQKCSCRDYHARNSLLPLLVKAVSKAQDVLSLVSLPKIDELYTMLNGSTVYSLLDGTSGYHHIALSPKAQMKSAFVMPIGKFKFKKVPLVLAQAPTFPTVNK